MKASMEIRILTLAIRILTLASREALRVWTVEHDMLNKFPDDVVAQEREKIALCELLEIQKLLVEAERR